MMQTLVKRLQSKKRGFTLIELIVVIAILGILAAILIPTMLGIVRDSRDQVKITNARAVYSAAHQAYTSAKLKNLAPVAGTYGNGSEDDNSNANAATFLADVAENLGAGFEDGASYTIIIGNVVEGDTTSDVAVTRVTFAREDDGRVAFFDPLTSIGGIEGVDDADVVDDG